MLRKALALAILLALSSLAWMGFIQPTMQSYRSHDESILRLQKLLLRYNEIGQEAKDLESQLGKARAAQRSRGGFLDGESVALAGADIQERLKRIIQNSGGRLKSTQILAVAEEDNSRRLGVRVNMAGDIASLQKALFALEAEIPFLFVDKLNIQASRFAKQEQRRASTNKRRAGANKRRAARRRTTKRGNPAELQIRFDVYAYLRSAVS